MNESRGRKRVPKYRQIFETLRREIQSGSYRPGQKLPTEAELEKRFGASRITVGRAVQELRQRDLVDRQAGSGTFVRAPKPDGMLFGLLIPNLGRTEIFEPICQGMADAVGNHALVWGRSKREEGSAEAAIQLCRQLISRKVSGVFFAPLEHTSGQGKADQRILAALSEEQIPVVLLDRDFLPYPQRSEYDLVGIDSRRAGYLATEHLLGLGMRRIAFWACPESVSTVGARIAGYRAALFDHGIAFDPKLVNRSDPTRKDGVRDFISDARPDSFVGANDVTAGALMRSLLDLDWRIPDDLRLVGIDDVRYASLLPVPLTTIHQPCRDIGAAAVATMLDRIARPKSAPRDVLLKCKLIVRDSCGASV